MFEAPLVHTQVVYGAIKFLVYSCVQPTIPLLAEPPAIAPAA